MKLNINKIISKSFLHYYYDIVIYNILFSFIIGITTFLIVQNFDFIKTFYICFNTVGFIGGLYLYHIFNVNEYYYYYNKGLSKFKLIIGSVILNMIFSIISIIFLSMLGFMRR